LTYCLKGIIPAAIWRVRERNCMNGKASIDTNIIVYAHDLDAGVKRRVSVGILEDMWDNRKGVLSRQVLQEFHMTVIKKIGGPISYLEAREIIRSYAGWEVKEDTSQSIIRASEIEERHHISFRDAMVVVAAYEAKVDKILTADLNPGQVIEGILIKNPFIAHDKKEHK
jgi:predicted nucleic acid-binding protein